MEGQNNQQNQPPTQTQPEVQIKVQQVPQQNTSAPQVKAQQKVQPVVNQEKEKPKPQEVKNQVPVQVQTKTEQKVEPAQITVTETVDVPENNESQVKNQEQKVESIQQQVKPQTEVLPQQKVESVEVSTKVEGTSEPEAVKQNQPQQKQEEIKPEQKVEQKAQVTKQKIQEQPIVKVQMSDLDWELQKLTVTIFDELKALQNSQKWQKYNDKPCPMFKIEIQSRIATKGIGIVNYTFEKVVQFLSDQTTLVALNPTCVDCRVLYKKPNELGVDIFRVNYMQYKATWPVSNRQFINVGAKRSEGQGKFYIGTKKCNYPYKEDKSIVRGQCYIGGYIIQRIDQKSTRVTYISDADIKGSIPGMVKNMLAKSQGEVAAKIQGVMKQAQKKKKK